MKYTIKNNICRHDWKILILLFLSALVLRCFRLFDLDVWFDEVVLLFQVKGSFADIWNYCKLDNFPPLFPWLMKLWSIIFPGENSLRVFSAILGSFTPPAAYLLGRELWGNRFGWLLGILCCFSPPLIYYSQMIRMYTLVPSLACLSIYGLLRAFETNYWRYWALTAISNLLGFYVFSFMLLLTMVEVVILIWKFKFKIKNIIRFLIVHIPVLFLISAWLGPLIFRYKHIKESFWIPPASKEELIKLWIFFGTGTDFGDRYLIALLLNLPFLLGFIIGLRNLRNNASIRLVVILFISVIAIVYVFSLIGQSLFFKRYFLFLLPVYFGIVFSGWLKIKNKCLRNCGLYITLASLLLSVVYYYFDYYEYHAGWGFITPHTATERGEGHAISKAARILVDEIQENEVIVHYSSEPLGSFSFFPMIYYHNRSLPEYIYSRNMIPQYCGQQYLRPGEWIRTLQDLNPSPSGIWVVTMNPIEEFFLDADKSANEKGYRWMSEINLPIELKEEGFIKRETMHVGALIIVHMRRITEIEMGNVFKTKQFR